MNHSIEAGDDTVVHMTLLKRVKFNAQQIRKGFSVPEVWRSVVFFCLAGCIIPNFSDYLYYYQMNVSNFSKLDYSLITLLGFIALLVSSFLYNSFFKSYEERCMLAVAMCINCVGSVMTLLFVLDKTFGLSPFLFVCLTSTVTDTIFLALSNLPSMVLFAKLIPSQIESSMFAMLMGLMNLSTTVLAKLLGNMYNSAIGVSNENLDDIWKLFVISTTLSVVPIGLVWLLPTKS
jgi:Na+/melibiose symporter-like transporter